MISFIKEGFGRGDKNAKKSEISVGGACFWVCKDVLVIGRKGCGVIVRLKWVFVVALVDCDGMWIRVRFEPIFFKKK